MQYLVFQIWSSNGNRFDVSDTTRSALIFWLAKSDFLLSGSIQNHDNKVQKYFQAQSPMSLLTL